MEIEISDGVARVVVGTSLCIQDVQDMHNQLMDQASWVTAWHFNLRAVAECDSAGLQWLLMITGWAQKEGIEMTLTEITEPVQQMIELYRVQGQFESVIRAAGQGSVSHV